MLRKLKKLRRMSRHEVTTRLAERVRVGRERRLVASGTSAQRQASGAHLLDQSALLLPGVQPRHLESLREEGSEHHNAWSSSARARVDEFLAGRWPLFSRICDLSGPIDWNTDPGGTYQWPLDFYADLPLYNLPTGVDVKYVWELGRHQFLADLGQDWLLNGREQSAAVAVSILRSWIAAAPIYRGIHWTSALEVAMRVISWSWALALLHRYPDWDQAALDEVAGSLQDHGEYLAHHLSYYSSPYNHLIGEAAGLWLVSQLCPEFEQSAHWSELSRSVLCQYGPRQFHTDGFSVEQASSYHAYTLSFLAMVQSTARSAKRPPFDPLNATIQAACQFAAALQMPDGCFPMLGDADSARVCPLLPADYWDFRSTMEWTRLAFDPDYRPQIPSQEAYWRLGAESLPPASVSPASVSPARSSRRALFRQSGYAVRKEGRQYLLFDVGPIADGLFSDATPSTAHGHADQLQVIVWNEQGQLTGDVGMPHYGGDPEWTNYARSSAAHNTIEIPDSGPVRPCGRLEWSHHAGPPRSLAFSIRDIDFLVAKADWPGAAVQRHIAVLPCGTVWVADWIEAEAPSPVKVHWQLTSSDAALNGWDATGLLTPHDVLASDSGPQAWRFPGYGDRVACRRRTFQLGPSSLHFMVSGLGSTSGMMVEHRGRRINCNEMPAPSDEPTNNAAQAWCWRFSDRGEQTLIRYLVPESYDQQVMCE
ncbi:MAG: heparinase II/III family protein, partial [Pirellulales bacterium]|nr:heparinase II/III family protein [Pirellulales bacterium]